MLETVSVAPGVGWLTGSYSGNPRSVRHLHRWAIEVLSTWKSLRCGPIHSVIASSRLITVTTPTVVNSRTGAASPGETQSFRQLQCQTSTTGFDPRIGSRNQPVAQFRARGGEDFWPPKPGARARWRNAGRREGDEAAPPLHACREPPRPARRGLLRIARGWISVGSSSWEDPQICGVRRLLLGGLGELRIDGADPTHL